MATTWWLLIRREPDREAIGIAEYVEPENYGPWAHGPGELYIGNTDHWLNTMHAKLTEQLGAEWAFDVISLAEFETFRDLHGLRVLGE